MILGAGGGGGFWGALIFVLGAGSLDGLFARELLENENDDEDDDDDDELLDAGA